MKSNDVLTALSAALKGDRDKLIRCIEVMEATERRSKHTDIANRLRFILNQYSTTRGVLVALPTLWHGMTAILPNRTLADLILGDAALHTLNTLQREHERRELLEENKLRPRNRLLFHGPPGNGKTAAAEAVAALLAVPLLVVSHHELIDSYMGNSSKNLAEAMKSASSQPCVLFIDEADAVMEQRGHDSSGQGRENNRIVNTLLMQMDTMPACVTLIAATNRFDVLDAAAVRRFDTLLEFPAPSAEQIVELVTRLKARHPVVREELFFVEHLSGKSFAEIETEVMNRARELVVAA